MLASIEIPHRQLNPRTLALQKFPRQMLNAVLDEETGRLLEYHHLIKRPKYREIWGHVYGNEWGQLSQGMQG